MAPTSYEITQLLLAWSEGDKQALDRLVPLVYEELRRLAQSYKRKEWAGRTLQTTSLIHDAYLRLIDADRVQWRNRARFFGVAARLIWPSTRRWAS
jgi:RNA polymerase sigma-70 factor, ECF subfamily